MSKVWFITGTSKGFGRVWAEAALERGDAVVATARDVSSLDALVERYGDDVLTLPLDVTDKAAVDAAVATAHARFGRLDVVVNNAGYGLFGAVEEVTEQQARAQLETNFFGALWVTQAVVPILRRQRSGHILQVSSIGGVHAFPVLGLYHASKWALEGLSQSLQGELEEFGVHVTLVEPGGFTTDWSGPSATRAEQLSEYDGVRERRFSRLRGVASRPGDPQATGAVILELVDMQEPPLRLFLGDAPLELIKPEYTARLQQWEAHADLAHRAQGEQVTA
ncbi:SDR family oxidoreductase [Conexibacter sp. JD483]|nr:MULTISPECIES: SDR family oxidoreductase [unclassified Conexibacter]MDO8189012.1 SDR family oxidoreductase [Conexibacter sp. CPCC 205706]MDO8201412.1 SDR family oxidoreductase [Conexibacter sp. CPCC 205762]MDR9371701.1 SDR family oxidoreductase [Conexibacter sp. JD483]